MCIRLQICVEVLRLHFQQRRCLEVVDLNAKMILVLVLNLSRSYVRNSRLSSCKEKAQVRPQAKVRPHHLRRTSLVDSGSLGAPGD